MVKNYPILKKTLPLFFLLFSFSAFSQTQTFSTPGTSTFTVPCDVTSITVEAWGGGGAGGGASANNSKGGGGGAGGSYASSILTVSPGQVIAYQVGSGAIGVTNVGAVGEGSWIVDATTVLAQGGAGGAAPNNTTVAGGIGSIASSIGDILFAGTSGANGTISIGGAGGQGANGGGGGGASRNTEGNGLIGTAPGGGGGGAFIPNNRNHTGGSGGNGQIRITYTSSFPTYCSPTFASGVEPITNVIFAGINNTTTNVTGGSSLESFCDIGTVVQGTTHQISLKGNTDGNYTNHFRVYVDWNQDGDFLDAGESYYIGTIINSDGTDKILIGNITVPATATLGNTRMRVMKRYNADPTDPCQTGTGFGQAEDYTINVTSPLDTYCTSYGNNADGYNTGIRLVNFNTINNATPIEDNDYSDFIAISTTVTKELSYGLTVNVNTDGNYTNYTYAWIDWNQDGDFSDPGESYNLGIATNVTDNPTLNSPLTITIPATAIVGPTRMRVSTKYFSAPGPCDAGFDGEVEDYTINIINAVNTWNGSVSTDWNNAANWNIGVPTIGLPNTLDVVIPSGLTNYPIILAGSVSGYVENIDLEAGSTLNVVDNSLRVTGNLTLNGNIDLEGESQLLQDTGSTFDAASTGTIEIDQQGEGNKYRYNYWSMPVYTANDGTNYTTIAAALRDGTTPSSPGAIIYNNSGYDGSISPFTLSSYWMFKYANSGSGYSAWDQIRSTGKVYTGQGFTMKGPGAPGSPEQNYVFDGQPNNGTIELTVAANYDYLVGNPYPSAIDAIQFIWDNATSITGAIYFWEHYGGDTHNLAGYQGGYATYSLSGGVQASAFPGLGGGISVKLAPKQFIPIGQAFFVVGDALDGGQIQFNNGQRVFEKESDGNSIFMKNSNTKAKTANTRGADLRPKFRIGFDAPKISHRQLLLTIDERATPAVDWGFDAEIYEIFADDMYWMLNNKKYVIQATNEVGLNSEVPLGLQLSKTGTVTVKIDALENVDDDTAVYLKDKVTGESFNMREKSVQLNLTAAKYTDRFVIVFKTQKLMAEDVNAEILIPAAPQPIIEGIHVFMNNAIGELQIKNNSTEEIISIALINSLGQTVKTWNSNFNVRTITLPISTATGVYLVRINTKTGNTVKKIIVEAP